MKLSTINIQPLGEQVAVVPIKEGDETTRSSGIFIPVQPKQDAPTTGEVIVLGTGGKDRFGDEIKFEFKVGDKVLFKQFVTTEYLVADEKVLLLSKEDVLAIIRD
jgi:chaperonin GroES